MHRSFPMKDQKGINITNAFQKKSKWNETQTKLSMGRNTGSEFYNRSMKLFFQNNDMEMCSKHNEAKSVIAEGFIRNFKYKIYRCLTSVSKHVYIDKLDDVVNKYNNTYNSVIKAKPVDVKANTYIDSSKEINDKDPKISDIVRVRIYRNNFSKD